MNIPNHVGIIMDGNGRWAEEKGLKRTEGHKEGSKTLKEVALYAFSCGVKVLSVFAFSTENFKREKSEVDYLMKLFAICFKEEFNIFKEKNIKVVFSKKCIGLPKNVLKMINDLERDTKNNTEGIFNVCINYGGRQEIIDTTKKITKLVLDKKINIEEINEKVIEQNLYQELPPIDLLIRTSGELRISNFMLWQSAYAELYFPKTYFPDFHEYEFDKALIEFNKRNRRFGGIKK